MFRAERFRPEEWAEIIRRSGAQYVVLTSKHHDGFCLWPSTDADRTWGRPWNSVTAGPRRDLLGELTEAVRKAGLKMGIYYSLYEWYNPLWIRDRSRYVSEHMIPQFRDVVTNYQPSLVFSDGEWEMPSRDWKSEELLAWLFNEFSGRNEVVVNDRWGKETRHRHGGYHTTEYTPGLEGGNHPWEETRGMGHSFGYNRNETAADYKSARELILMLIDLVSRGGNFLLGIGPAADGSIPGIMQETLENIGAWLDVNGEAIYGTRAWRQSRQWTSGHVPQLEYGGAYERKYDILEITGSPTEGRAVVEVLFTSRGDTLYAIAPRWPGRELRVKNLHVSPRTSVTLLGHKGDVKWNPSGRGIIIEAPDHRLDGAPEEYPIVFRLTNVR